jgi:MFS family permease
MSSSRRIFFALFLANITYAVSQSMLIPSIPLIEKEVHTSAVGATSLMSVFFISGAVTAGLFGRLGDMIGKQRMVMVQLALFASGALICALANSLALLLVGRATMGLAAALFPLSASIVRDELHGPRVMHAVAMLGAAIGLGSGIGFTFGGLVAGQLGYHAVFWIPLAFSSCALIGVVTVVPKSSNTSPGRLDVLGACLLTLGLGCPLVAISRTPVWGWGSGKTALLMIAGLVVLAVFVAHERRHPEPLLDIELLRERVVALTNAAKFLVGFGMFGAGIILIQFTQTPSSTGWGFGASTTQSGLYLLPGSIVMLFCAPISGRMSARSGGRATLLVGTGAGVIPLGLLIFFHQSPIELILWPTMWAVGSGFAFAAMPTLILGAVAPDKRGQATAVNQIFRLVGSALGTQLAATFIASSARGGRLPAESGYTHAFLIEMLGALSGFLVTLTIPRMGRRPEPQPALLAAEGVASASELS